MTDITLILLGAGSSTRFELPVKKQWLYTDDAPLWLFVARQFDCYNFDQTIIVSSQEEIVHMQNFASYTFIEGGKDRQTSLSNGLKAVKTPWVLVSDIARCCVDHDAISRILATKEAGDSIVPALQVIDTLYLSNKPANREEAKLIQTPQLSRTNLLTKAISQDTIFTDESSAMLAQGHKVFFVEGSHRAHKLTTISDIQKLTCLKPPKQCTFTGFGIDTHAFEANKPMVLGGVAIAGDIGFKAHSDGDVAIHAIIDALLGAASLGDIGELFPDTDSQYLGADSKKLLTKVAQKVYQYGFDISHVDITIVAQIPKISPYKKSMRTTLATILNISPHRINIKATTSENLGFIGRKEGISVHAVANLTYFDWKNS